MATPDKILVIGKAISAALYRSTYNGERNIPKLSIDQEYAAGLAAIEAIAEIERQQNLRMGD
jgi:hypothetical protein